MGDCRQKRQNPFKESDWCPSIYYQTPHAHIEDQRHVKPRPILPPSSDPNDLSVLTPGHFLIGQPQLALRENYVVNTSTNRLIVGN